MRLSCPTCGLASTVGFRLRRGVRPVICLGHYCGERSPLGSCQVKPTGNWLYCCNPPSRHTKAGAGVACKQQIGGFVGHLGGALPRPTLSTPPPLPLTPHPNSMRLMLQATKELVPVEHLAVHFHDTYCQALANLLVCQCLTPTPNP